MKYQLTISAEWDDEKSEDEFKKDLAIYIDELMDIDILSTEMGTIHYGKKWDTDLRLIKITEEKKKKKD